MLFAEPLRSLLLEKYWQQEVWLPDVHLHSDARYCLSGALVIPDIRPENFVDNSLKLPKG